MTGNAESCSAGGAEIKLDGRDYLIVKEQEVFSRHRKVDRGDNGERVIKGWVSVCAHLSAGDL